MKILIVEDNPEKHRELIEQFELMCPNALIEGAYNFINAETRIKSKEYDVTMLDGMISNVVTTPPEHGYGYNLIPIIKKHCPFAKIIMISGDKECNEIGLKMGAHMAIPKPMLENMYKFLYILEIVK